MMTFIVLAFFSLASSGITTTVSLTVLGSEVKVEVETKEVQERLLSSTSRRVRTRRLVKYAPPGVALFLARCKLTGTTIRPLPIVGHRLPNGFLVPIRC